MAVESQLMRKMAVLAKVESAYGQDAEPSEGLSAILVNAGVEIAPSGDQVKRDVVRDKFSAMGSVIGAKWQTLTVRCEARGGGLNSGAPVAPDYEPFLLACGLQKTAVTRLTRHGITGNFVLGETVTGGVSAAHGTVHQVDAETVVLSGVNGFFEAGESMTGALSTATAAIASVAEGLEYRPVTDRLKDQTSALVFLHMDGILHKVVGARGTCSLDLASGKNGTWEFRLTGLWVDPADAALPVPVLTDIVPPIFVGAAARIGTYVPVITSLKLDVGNDVKSRADANAPEGIVEHYIAGRETKGSLDPEVDKLSSFNPWNLWRTSGRASIAANLGATSGNRLRMTVPNGQLDDPKYADKQGLRQYNIGYIARADAAGDDEARVTFL